MSGLRERVAVSVLAAALALAGGAAAQPEPEQLEAPAAEAPVHPSVIEQFSVGRLAHRLEADDPDQRLSAIERLGSIGTSASIARLTEYAFEHRAQLVGREWLTLARVLAPHAAEGKAQLVLATLLNQSASKAAGPDEVALAELARGTAALALADEGGTSALAVLGRALRTIGKPAAAAAAALVAHPPGSLEPLLDVPGPPSAELARLLGALGDQRAFHALRGWVRGAEPDVRVAAAVALTELGHLETVPLGAQWLARAEPELQQGGLEILLAAQDPRAEPALRELLVSPRLARADRQRLLDVAGASLSSAALAGLDPAALDADGSWRWTLLGRIGGRVASERLGQALSDPDASFAAAHALSRLPGPEAHAALQAALDAGQALPLSLRAAAVRRRAWGESFVGLDARAAALAGSERPEERALAAWVHALSGGEAALEELGSGDVVRVAAAANNALGFDAPALALAARALSGAPAGPLRTALGVCLISREGRDALSSELLWSLVAEAGAARPLALRALAARSDPDAATGVTSYLDHPDGLLREHVALGLGDNASPSAVASLVRRLTFETDESVRHALVMALGAHPGRLARHWLESSARLDPSAAVRSASRLALAGVPLAEAPRAEQFLWAQLRPTQPPAPAAAELAEAPGAAVLRAAVLLRAGPGLALPVFADAAGLLVVAGSSSSRWELWL
jgi:HEAT repeat protein